METKEELSRSINPIKLIEEEIKEKPKRKETGNYIFPKGIAKKMMKISIRTQMEASLMAMSFIIVGILASSIFLVFFTEIGLFTKIASSITMLAIVALLSSQIITQFQSYRAYLNVMGVINQ